MPKSPKTSLERSFGILHRPGMSPVSVREMDDAIGQFHAEEDARIRNGRGAAEPLQDLFGMLRRPDIPPRTLEEMREGMIELLVQEDERVKKGEE